MSAITRPISTSSRQLRPFDVGRDLKDVAVLVEACFAPTLDVDSRRYVQQMNAAAENPRYLRWAATVAGHVSMPLTGYVWEENGRIVGNLSLIPFTYRGNRRFLIANVAVDPHYRRRGIARALTEVALDHIRKRGASEAWLHVREENIAALNLYTDLGFKEQARRTTWESAGGLPPLEAGSLPAGVKIAPRGAQHWPQQRSWLKQLYPPELTWHLPFNLLALQPGWLGAFYRLFTAAQTRHWAATQGNRLLGVLTWQPQLGHPDHLWFAAGPEMDDQAATGLLAHARRHLINRSRLVVDFPARHCAQAFQNSGFQIQQTLIWMSVSFK